jgi:NET1-associated nuclear protein 1 (U3 small nucleolar RNA-associated protein 17)
MFLPSLTHFQFHSAAAGDFMATVDVRKGERMEGEISLKLWEWCSQKSVYRLSAQVDRPHGVSRVTAVVFAPSLVGDKRGSGADSANNAIVCCTAGADGSIKMWRYVVPGNAITMDR